MDISKTVALVTGGASGLGAACVRAVVDAGGSAVIADVNIERGEALAAELGASVRFQRTDVTSESDVQAAVDLAVSTFGTINAGICCAGIGTVGKTLGRKGPLPLDVFTKTITINLIGTANTCRLVAAAMAETEPNAGGERGALIMTASVAAFDGQMGQLSYSASKGGIVGMTLPMARDLARFGIRVMTLAPGIFDTPLLASLPEAARISLGQQVPFPPRLGQPSEFAALAMQILSNSMLNGETIRIDGAIRMAPK
ncbi:MAG: NAD(P)-dependent dehydrogenase (short-subunit alcohol dehydrogenase family) [Myxococcota bacterium]|jgi:NAD(P)-dependent dehydrogenase (short-subunit alcohol dehydrogenase family)